MLQGEEILDLLGQMIDKSIVISGLNALGTETRCHMLETIRQFAYDRLSCLLVPSARYYYMELSSGLFRCRG